MAAITTMAVAKKAGGGRRAPHANPIKMSKPGDDDILCGKDRSCALHPGSQRFRVVIDSYRATYQKATTKYDKMCITKEIYEILSQKARFLKFNDQEKVWEEITPLQGRDKIGHALRFANNHNASKGVVPKVKRSRKSLKRQGSFSSTSATSGASSSVVAPTKKDLVKELVEVAKEEPKVFDAIVDHLTLQEALASPEADGLGSAPQALIGTAVPHRRVASTVDPVALENIAYAVDCNADEEALDELISLLNHDETITEEDIQDVLDMAAEAMGPDVPPTIAISMGADIGAPLAPISCGSIDDMDHEESFCAPHDARDVGEIDEDVDICIDPIVHAHWR